MAMLRNTFRTVPGAQGKTAAKLVVVDSTYPMDLVCMDFLSVEISAGGTSTSWLSKTILPDTLKPSLHETKQPRPQPDSYLTRLFFYYYYFSHYGFPSLLHSDQGRNFESEVIKELCAIASEDKTRTTPYHPMGNGMPERFNQTLLNMLGTLKEDQKSDSKTYVPPLVYAYNATRHESTGFPPH